MKLAPNGQKIESCLECGNREHKLPMGFICIDTEKGVGDGMSIPHWCPLADYEETEDAATLSDEKYATISDRIGDLIDSDAPENDILDAVLIELGMKETTPGLPPQPWSPKGDERIVDSEGETIAVCRYWNDIMTDAIVGLIVNAPRLLDLCKDLANLEHGEKTLGDLIATAKKIIEDMQNE